MSGAAPHAVGVGVIGAGDVSAQYLINLVRYPDVNVLFVGDRHADRAARRAREFSVPRWGSPAQLLDDPQIELVVNLTTPASHAEVALTAIAAGKHVWNEKPLASTPANARRILDAAARRGVQVGAAPDAFLGPKFQTARRLIVAGAIGELRTASVVSTQSGPESWHPNPEFLFQPGAGPLLDSGPYAIAALVQLFGPIRAVAAAADTARRMRTIGSGPRAGTTFTVTTPTCVSALFGFDAGRTAQVLLSFDSALAESRFDVSGTTGVLELGDVGRFAGPLRVHRRTAEEEEIDVPGRDWERGLGVVDLARAIRSGSPIQSSGEFAAHVVDGLDGALRAATTREWISIEDRFTPAPPLPEGWDPTQATLTLR